MRERDRLRVFIVAEQSIERHEHLYPVGMGITNHLLQILEAVACRLTRTESRRTYVYSIRTRLHCRPRYFFVASRSEEAKRYITMPAVTDTFIECFVPYWGISMHP